MCYTFTSVRDICYKYFICKGELKEWNKGLLEILAVHLRSKFVPLHAIKGYWGAEASDIHS
jgi:hypothetical protein